MLLPGASEAAARSALREPILYFLYYLLVSFYCDLKLTILEASPVVKGKARCGASWICLHGIEKPDLSHGARILATSMALAKPKRCERNDENHKHGCFRLVANPLFVLRLLTVSDSSPPDTTVRCAFAARENFRIAEHFRSEQA
jgi:hypothetical protein